MTAFATYRYLVDWTGNGLCGHAQSDISAYVIESSFQRGSMDGIPAQSGAGVLTLKLDNSSAIFSPDNQDSPLYGLAVPFLRIRMLMTSGGSESVMFTGFLDSIDPTVAMPATISTAQLRAFGILSRIQDETVDLSLMENTSACWLIGALMEAAGISSGDYDVDLGQSVISKYWVKSGGNLLQAIRDLEAEELGHIAEDPEGILVAWDRTHYFDDTRSGTIQAVYGNGTLNIWNLRRINSLRGIYNSVESQVRTFNVTDDDILLATITDVPNGLGGTPLIVPAAGSLTVFIDFPGKDTPSQYVGVESWGIVDFQANSAKDGTGVDLTASLSESSRHEYGPRLMVVFSNSGATPAHLTVLRAHGVATVEGDPVPIKSEDAASIAKYGRRPYPFSFNWITDATDGQAKLDYVISEYKDPRAKIAFDVMGNYDAAHLAEVKTRREGDRIRVVAGDEFGMGMDAEFIVDAVSHAVSSGLIHVMTLYCTAAPIAQLAADGTERVPNPIATNSSERPDQLWTTGLPLSESILIFCGANKWNSGIYEAEVRAMRIPSGTICKSVDLRTAAEGGTFADNGTTQLIATGLYADWEGVRHQLFYGANSGIWYWAVRLKNAAGWSNWTDGNKDPQYVTDKIDTRDLSLIDVGPPARWTITLRSGVQENTAVVVATRPSVNGNRIMSAAFQIRDATSGAWRNIDADAGAADTLYEGSEIDHIYNPIEGTLRKDSGDYGGAIGVGGLLLIDVRQGSFDHRCCFWRELTADQINGMEISGIQPFPASFDPNVDGEYTLLRVKIVRPPSVWNATQPAANVDGFLAETGYRIRDFVYGGMVGDVDTDEFMSPPFAIPAGLTISDLEARVWFENVFSVSDDENHDTEIVDAAKKLSVPILLTCTVVGEGAAAPAAGAWAMIRVPCDLYIAGVTVLADAAGNIQFDVRRCLYDSYPDGPGDSIVAASPPVLAGAQRYQDYTLTGWARTLNQAECLIIRVGVGATVMKRATLTMECYATLTMGSGSAPGSQTLPMPWAYWPMDEVSNFQVHGAPSAWWAGSGSAEGGRHLYFKHTFQLEGDVESLANGTALGPIYIPPDKYFKNYWKSQSRAIGIGDWSGGGAGGLYYDDAEALANIRLRGFRIYMGTAFSHTAIAGYQAIYENATGALVYGTLRGISTGVLSTLLLGDNEFITGVQGYHHGNTSYQAVIMRLTFTTNLGTYNYGDAYGTPWSLTMPVPGTPNGSYTFAGLYGSYSENFIRRIGLLFYVDTFDATDRQPVGVIGWNIYASEDADTYEKKNTDGYLAIDAPYDESA